MSGTVRLELPTELDGLQDARHFVTKQLCAWGYDAVASDAALLTSELVTNAMRHASPPYAVEVLDLHGGVLVTVEDSGHGLPERRWPPPEAVSGRGLGIVDSIAAEWGAWPVDHGKVVWFRLAAAER